MLRFLRLLLVLCLSTTSSWTIRSHPGGCLRTDKNGVRKNSGSWRRALLQLCGLHQEEEKEGDRAFTRTSDRHNIYYSHQQPLLDAISSSLSTSLVNHKNTDACRIFHGRGGIYPGCAHLTLDWFPPVWLLTSHKVDLSLEDLDEIRDTLQTKWNQQQQIIMTTTKDDESPASTNNTFHLVYQLRANTTTTSSTILAGGELPETHHVVTEKDMKFGIRLHHNVKNHGLFLDMANGRSWVRQHAQNQNVLNLFAYTCSFSIAALFGGASQVVNVDKVKGVLKVGQRNHDLNDLRRGGARFLAHDVFKTWGKIRKLGPYGMIVVDPPSFQKGSFVAKRDYAKVLRRLPGLLEPGGKVLLCLNAPELDTAWLKQEVLTAAPELVFVERLSNPEAFPSVDAERSLKVLVYHLS